MRLRKTIKCGKILLCCLGCVCLQTAAVGQMSRADSIQAARTNEANFIVNQIENVYPYGRRGISDSTWNSRVQRVHQKVNSATSHSEYLYALRYTGALIKDAHFAFPDAAVYNRCRVFNKTDTIFPMWVKTWTDGQVYVVKDYTGALPQNAQIVSINGRSAQQMALLNRSLQPSEERYAMASMNTHSEPAPRYWNNFRSFLFMEGIKPPYKVSYIAPATSSIDTVTIYGMARQDMVKIHKKNGEKRAIRKPFKKVLQYERIGKTSAVLTLNMFWGRSLLEMLIFHKDLTYPCKLKSVMARIARHKIDTLIIDISNNGGGMADNLYKTLNYFTTKPIDANSTFYVTDNNRAIMKRVIGNSPYEFFGLSKEQKAQMASFVDSIGDGGSFCTDTLFDLKFKPDSVLKHRYTGKVYLVTSSCTYSAAQQFAQAFQRLGIGQVAGQPCGGYRSITGGNAMYVKLPYISRGFTFMVPYSTLGHRGDAGRFDYERVDIPLEITFDEWLRDENRTVEKLLKILRACSRSFNNKPNKCEYHKLET